MSDDVLMRSAILLIALLAGSNQAPDAKGRMAEFIAALNSKDRVKIKAMMDSSFAPGIFQSRKPEEWLNQTMQIATDMAPVTVLESPLEKPATAVVQVKISDGSKFGIRIDCEPEPPHRIIGIRIDSNLNALIRERKVVDYSNYQSLTDLMRRIREDNKVPAIIVSVWQDGKMDTAVDGVRMVGKPDLAHKNDLWLVGSIGKSMTSTLVATLIEEGKLSWDSKLGDVLKDIPMKDGYKEVTVEQLMQHIGGIPQDLNFTAATVNRIVGTLKDPVEIRAAYAKDILSREPIGKPGERFSYSNAGYALLGHIAERVAKKPFAAIMKERVFGRIGMKSALCGMPGEKGMPSGPNQPHGHYPMEDGPRPGKLGGPLTHMAAPAGGGVACSIEDLNRYAVWHLRGFLGESVPGMKPETIKRLHTPLRTSAGGERYAAGWSIGPMMHAHNGSDGTFLAEMAIFPEKRVAVVSISNMGNEDESAPLQAIMAIRKRLVGER